AGYDAYKRGDYATAHRVWRSLADGGDASAQYNLGLLYHHGLGVERKLSEAAKWYGRAAENGDADAQKAIGDLYLKGFWGKKNSAKAATWYRKAAEQGHAGAKEALLRLGAKRQGGPRQAAPSDAPTEYQKGQAAYKRRDYAEAARRYRKAAEQGHVSAQFRLGIMYAKGRGVRRDYAEALKWYRKAAERGHSNAQLSVGARYERGQGVTRDYAKAVMWYRRAAKQGYPWALRNLGLMYYRGKGVPKDYVRAHLWLNLAVSRFRPGKYRNQALKRRTTAERVMTAAEIAGARRLARAVEDHREAHGRYPDDAVIQAKMRELNLMAGQAPPAEEPERAPPDLVKKVQQALKDLGYDIGPADGTLGPSTRAAVRAFQADAGIAAKGRVSERLLTRLERSMARTSPPRAADKNPVRLVRAGRKLSLADARILERKLARDPDALWVRAKLLGFYFHQAKRALGAGPTIEARRRHVLWLIRNHPETRLAGSSEATIDPIGHALADEEGYQEARALWLDQAKRKGDNKKLLLNAAKFLQLHDKELAAAMHVRAGNPLGLGYLYALGVLRVNMMNQNGIPTSVGETEADFAFATKAREALEGSSDPLLLATAGHILLRYGVMVNRGKIDAELMVFVESLLKKAGVSLEGFYEIKGMLATSPGEKRALAEKRLAELEKGRRPGATGKLEKLAKAAFAAGDMRKAGLYANELLDAGMKPGNEKRRGTAVHHGNLILGRIALKQGKKESAKAFLIEAGRSSGGGTLGSFGPNMALAKELLEAGEKAAVIEYLRLCKSFWDYDRKKGTLDRWIKTIRAGGTPEFGPNLIY
ncbi:MAG: peptidoglycan-binding protein, partial [Alphaproteobacteria bacterium]|nr:peptidoglycan-binding protein [Alphaproteobacteria bacterium]